MNYVGIDLHSNNFTCNFLEKDNMNLKMTYPITNNHLNLTEFYNRLTPQDYVVIEASTNTFSFYDIIKPKVKEVLVVNPLEFKIINESGKKTDKIDAQKLSKMLKYHVETDKNFLPLVYVPEKEIIKLRSLFTTYKLLKKEETISKNRIHSLLKQNLKPYNHESIFSGEKREEILNLEIDEAYKIQIKLLYQTIDYLAGQIKQIKDKILYEGRKYKDQIKILTSVHGISAFIAIALISDYADINRFKNGKHFSSYLRSAPKIHHSNETMHIGKTNRSGRKLSLSLLLQSISHFRKINPYLEEFYQKKCQGKSKGKVRIAIARKMFVSLYYMLRNKKYYNYRDVKVHELKMKTYEKFVIRYEKEILQNIVDNYLNKKEGLN